MTMKKGMQEITGKWEYVQKWGINMSGAAARTGELIK